jgi:glycosyltransferase involved in cell wall biosynthesis
VHCRIQKKWPESSAALLLKRPAVVRVGAKIYDALFLRRHAQSLLSCVAPGDVVWVNGNLEASAKSPCHVEKALVQLGARYLYHLEDNWLDVPFLRQGCVERIRMAAAVGVVTPMLRERVLREFPEKRVLLLEEAIDTDRFETIQTGTSTDLPVVVWTGRPGNLRHLTQAADVLATVYRQQQFCLRVLTGTRKPGLLLPVPWEWRAYSCTNEAANVRGAVAGLAWFEDTPYNACKGNYKIKTYLAAGIPPITTATGYNNVLVQPGKTGFLVDSAGQFGAAILELLQKPELASTMGRQAHADMITRFSPGNLVPKWMETLHSCFPDFQ